MVVVLMLILIGAILVVLVILFYRGLMSPEFWDLSVLLPEYISDTRIMAE